VLGGSVVRYELEDWSRGLSALLDHVDERLVSPLGVDLAQRMRYHARALAPVDRGNLRRSLDARWMVRDRRIVVTSTVPYARIQDQGGRIFARGRRLTIKRPGLYVGPREYPGTLFPRAGGGGRTMLLDREAGRLQYTLADSVYIPGSRYLARSAVATMRELPDRVARLAEIVTRLGRS
jgi:hypothetical protein